MDPAPTKRSVFFMICHYRSNKFSAEILSLKESEQDEMCGIQVSITNTVWSTIHRHEGHESLSDWSQAPRGYPWLCWSTFRYVSYSNTCGCLACGYIEYQVSQFNQNYVTIRKQHLFTFRRLYSFVFSGSNTYYGYDGRDRVERDGVMFEFRNSPLSTGTDVGSGQIAGIYFRVILNS